MNDPASDPRTAPRQKTPGTKTGPSPADEPRSSQTGTAPAPSTGGGRTGRTKGDRQTDADEG